MNLDYGFMTFIFFFLLIVCLSVLDYVATWFRRRSFRLSEEWRYQNRGGR